MIPFLRFLRQESKEEKNWINIYETQAISPNKEKNKNGTEVKFQKFTI